MSIVENDTLAERAPKLCDRIKDKRTLIVLDDVWEQIDVVAIGLPCLLNCKLVLTCRNRKDLSLDMRRQKDISLDVLNKTEAWGLFEKMAGEVVKDDSIRNVAMKVAKKCGGLPLLIVTVARALKGKNKLHAWNDTWRRLKLFDKKGSMKKAYLALEWSYDQLEDEELKQLFLICGIIVIENRIYLEDLLKYGVGLGLFENVNTIEETQDLLGTLVEKLTDSCLLLDSGRNKYFRMHDLVCEVASGIASRDQHILSVGYGAELKEWPDKDFFKRCSKMSLECSNIPMLSEVPRECPKLEMFYLYSIAKRNKLVEIPSNFFSEMEKLKVLSLTKLHMLSLPSSLQFLKNLQTLCLEECNFKKIELVGHLSNLEILSFARSIIQYLPKEIGQLIRLRWLDLSDCYFLAMISPNVISRLERLEVLRMRNSFHKWEAKREGSNASLLELKLLSRLTALELYIPDARILPTDLFSNKLIRYNIHIGNASKKTMLETTLNTLNVKLSTGNELDQGLKTLMKRCEDLSLDGTKSGNSIVYQSDIEDFQRLKHLHLQNNVDFTYMIDRKVVFSNLTALSVHCCGRLRFLFSFSMAKSLVELKHLEVSTCKIMVEIVSTRDQSNEETVDNMFRKLESLTLDQLPNLARFYARSYIEFPPEKQFNTELGASICDPRTGKKLKVKDETIVHKCLFDSHPRTGKKFKVKGETIVHNCLFDSQVKFPSLEKLKINELGKLQTIWNNQFVDQDSFCRLREIYVSRCKSLQKIFPTSVARGLQNLYELTLEGCDEVKEIIACEGLETMCPLFVFPKVTSVRFFDMPKLRRFYPGMHTSKWPLLKVLDVIRCDRVKMFAAELPIFWEKHELNLVIEQSLFLIDKDSFPNLEKLSLGVVEIWYGPSPAHFCSKLKTIWFRNCVCTHFTKQAALLLLHKLVKLQNLDILYVSNTDWEEIFVNLEEINSGGEMKIHAVGTLNLPRVKHLHLYELSNLLHLGNSQPAGSLFPNLDTLDVFRCSKLKSVESSAISFCYLTTLRVTYCGGLEYLTSYSVAKSLVQLTTLTVWHCSGLREIIVASNEDDHCEIAFSRLQHLSFMDLPRLQGFCSGNCIVKLPSSTELNVYGCGIGLKISSQGVLHSCSGWRADWYKPEKTKAV